MTKARTTIFYLITVLTVTTPLLSQDTMIRDKALRVYLDIGHHYDTHVKREITFVNYMRDRLQAQVYIMMTTQPNGSSGHEYTLVFFGQEKFNGVNDTLIYHSRQSDTEEMTRDRILAKIKMGLIRYVSETPLADDIKITYNVASDEAESVKDHWNHWVFNIDLDTDVDGEELQKDYQVDGSFSADRVTEAWKLSFNVNGEYEEEHYTVDSGNILSVSRSWGARALIVKSLGPHWSIGGYGSTRSSTYSNIDLSVEVAPAIEYNIFPYAESTRREFRILYKTGIKTARYRELTIYDKLEENLWYQSLGATFELKERWGSIAAYLTGSHYFHDFSKNNLSFRTSLNLRLFEGFSLYLSGRYTSIHDQLSLENEGASEQDILLHRKEIATQYDYSYSIGFRYTFGSIFSNIVNPRFGNDDH